jgi:hypothetical protein
MSIAKSASAQNITTNIVILDRPSICPTKAIRAGARKSHRAMRQQFRQGIRQGIRQQSEAPGKILSYRSHDLLHSLKSTGSDLFPSM